MVCGCGSMGRIYVRCELSFWERVQPYSREHRHDFPLAPQNPNIGVVTLRAWANSWGTSKDTIIVRIAASGGKGNYYQYNARYQQGYRQAPILLTVTEVETNLQKSIGNGAVKQVASKTLTGVYMCGVVCLTGLWLSRVPSPKGLFWSCAS